MLRLKKQTCYPCGMPFSRCLFALTLFVSSALQAQTAPSPDNAALAQAFSYALDDVSTFSVPSAALELDTEALSTTATPSPTPSHSASSNAGEPAEHDWLPQITHAGETVAHNTKQLISTAIQFMGVPYRRGGSNAASGFDCSGFVRNVYADALGLVLPRVARDQANATKKIEKKELRPGDLVFFNTMRRTFSHVGIYLGEGKFIHSPRSGSSVRIDSMNTKYWSARFNGARRVASVASLSSTGTANYALTP